MMVDVRRMLLEVKRVSKTTNSDTKAGLIAVLDGGFDTSFARLYYGFIDSYNSGKDSREKLISCLDFLKNIKNQETTELKHFLFWILFPGFRYYLKNVISGTDNQIILLISEILHNINYPDKNTELFLDYLVEINYDIDSIVKIILASKISKLTNKQLIYILENIDLSSEDIPELIRRNLVEEKFLELAYRLGKG